jgi:transposase
MGRPTKPIVLTEEERSKLQEWARRPKTAQRLALRARIVLGFAEGLENLQVARQLRITDQTVCKWRSRFGVSRLEGLTDEPRPGAPRKITDQEVEAVITRTLEATPGPTTHWSTRSMAKAVGLSQSAISRIWRAFSLQPHRVETFKLSSDPFFIEKVRDIAGLYLNPPERALVLCVDEKSQIQALDRTRPILPLRPGVPARQSHDYVRNGTTSLFAALDVATGKVIGSLHHRQRHQEFLRFLEKVDAAVPEPLEIHLVMDNYGTHKMPKVKRWFARRPRYHLHFTSRPLAPVGSIKSNASLACSPNGEFGAAPSEVFVNWKTRSAPTWLITIRTRNRSNGLPMPIPFSKRSSDFVCVLLT